MRYRCRRRRWDGRERCCRSSCSSRSSCGSGCRCECSCSSSSSCGCWCRRWCSTRQYRVALRASGCASSAVAEVLIEGSVVFLHSRCGRCVAIGHCAVDHVKASLPLIQPQLEVGTAAPAAPQEVLRPPLNVEDAVGSIATYRGEYTKPTVDQIQVGPVRHDGVVVGEPRQALGEEGRIRGRELR